jgi:hypothetical protein
MAWPLHMPLQSLPAHQLLRSPAGIYNTSVASLYTAHMHKVLRTWHMPLQSLPAHQLLHSPVDMYNTTVDSVFTMHMHMVLHSTAPGAAAKKDASHQPHLFQSEPALDVAGH